MDTPADLNLIPPADAVPPLAEPVRAPAISRSTVAIIAVATVVILIGLGLLGRVISEHHQANSLYAAPSAPLAVADANASADKAKAAADRARAAAERAQAVTANKTAEP